MSCTRGSSYTVKAGDTLYIIAQQQLGEGNRWREIIKPNGSPFTEEEAYNLQQGQEIYLPESTSPPPPLGGGMDKGNFQNMLEALGAFGSGLRSGDPNQYKVENSLGFIGKYQFGEPLLIDLGYYKADVYYGNGANKNYWQGTWTGKKGMNRKEQFQNSPDVQEFAIREAFYLNWQLVNRALGLQVKSINNYLCKQKTFINGGVLKTFTITLSGILAGAHLRGPYGVANLLLNNQVSHDEFGNSILLYMEEYGGYNVTPADFSSHLQ